MAYLRVKNSLKSIYVCQGCLAGPLIPEIEGLVQLPKAAEPVVLPVPIGNYLKADVCEVCTGLNQLIRSEEFLSQVDRSIEESGYEFRSFNFNFRMPLSLKIRQAYIRELLHKEVLEWDEHIKKEDLQLAATADLKNQIKQFLNIRFMKKLNVPVDNTDEFAILVEFLNDKDERDMVS